MTQPHNMKKKKFNENAPFKGKWMNEVNERYQTRHYAPCHVIISQKVVALSRVDKHFEHFKCK